MNEPVTVSTLILILFFFFYPETLAGVLYLPFLALYGALWLFFRMLVDPWGILVLLVGSYFFIDSSAPKYSLYAYGVVVIAISIHEAIKEAIKIDSESQNESAS